MSLRPSRLPARTGWHRQFTCALAILGGSLAVNAAPTPHGVVMTKSPVPLTQIYACLPDFPADFIRQGYDDGYMISTAAYANGVWAVAMAKGLGWGRQSYTQAPNLPHSWLQEKEQDGYTLSSIAASPDSILVVASKIPGRTKPQTSIHSAFWQCHEGPTAEGRSLVCIGYLAPLNHFPGTAAHNFVAHYATLPGVTAQRSAERSQFPKDYIENGWQDGFRITLLEYSAGHWNIGMTKSASTPQQRWLGFDAPDTIHELIRANWQITLFY